MIITGGVKSTVGASAIKTIRARSTKKNRKTRRRTTRKQRGGGGITITSNGRLAEKITEQQQLDIRLSLAVTNGNFEV